MAVSLPTDGTEYPMMLGSSFHAGQPEQSDLCLLHYSFKPASAGRFQKGGIYVQPEQQKLHLQLPNNSNQASDLDFTGSYEVCKDGLDCLASFDGTSWRLDLVGAVGRHLRQQKGSFPRQPHSADAQQRPARAQTPQIEVIAPEPQDAGDPAEQPSAFPQGIDEDQTADLAEDIDLEQELEGALEEAGSPEREESPQPRQGTNSTGGASGSQPSDEAVDGEAGPGPPAHGNAAKHHLPKVGVDKAELGEMEREFLGEMSDSEVDEEELNRCSDDEVDADFD